MPVPVKIIFNGEYLINAQGEDVVAGIRTPQQITKEGSLRWAELANISEKRRAEKYPSLEEAYATFTKNSIKSSKNWKIITKICRTWNSPFRKVNYGCCRPVTENAPDAAMVKIAMDMLKEEMIDDKDCRDAR